MPHRPPNIAQQQGNDLTGGGRETQDVQLMIYKDGGDTRPGQQVIHIIVDPRKIHHFGAQFRVDRGQLFVYRLQFFLGGFQFLVGGLQFLVNRLHFLVR